MIVAFFDALYRCSLRGTEENREETVTVAEVGTGPLPDFKP